MGESIEFLLFEIINVVESPLYISLISIFLIIKSVFVNNSLFSFWLRQYSEFPILFIFYEFYNKPSFFYF